jgi:hypothetical protein
MEKKRRRRGGKRRNAHFMDVALDGYVRDIALAKIREVEDLIETARLEQDAALQSAAVFQERAPYHETWSRWWEREVLSRPGGESMERLAGPIEAAVRGAILEERERRSEEGAPTIEDTLHYKAFVDRVMEMLLEEASGEIEEL